VNVDSRAGALEALVQVRLDAPTDHARFGQFLLAESDVVAAWQVVGDIDVVVHLCCADLPALEDTLTRMRVTGGAAGTVTHLVLRRLGATPPTAREGADPLPSQPVATRGGRCRSV
jgi:hypothetical protein